MRQPAEIVDAIVSAQVDYKELVFDPETAKVFNAAWTMFQQGTVLNGANLSRVVNTAMLAEIVKIADGPDLISRDEVIEEILLWRGIRATDQQQRHYAEWRRAGLIDIGGFQDVISNMEMTTGKSIACLAKQDNDPEAEFYKGNTLPFDTGIPWLTNHLNGGWRIGSMEVFAGHAKGGKTLFQANLTAKQLMMGRTALVIQRERSEQIYRDFVLSAMLSLCGYRIPYERIERREIHDDEREIVTQCHNSMKASLRITTSVYTVPQIKAWAKVKKMELGSQDTLLMQIDHLNVLMHSDGKGSLAAGLAMENVVYALHDMTNPDPRVGLGIPIALTAQLDDGAGRILKAKGELKSEEFMIRSCRAIEMGVDTAWSMGRSKQMGKVVFQKHVDRNGDGADNSPIDVPYNHILRWFVEGIG